ncbi:MULTISPECIES: RNA polymerase sigma factor [Rhodanobacteraceae]|uniref:RNA polymerase sigma factor n=1 Tax=Rhodanobacteraceae TaxID=1775411 RepID=UPI000566CA83|nr:MULTISPECIES: sigma-70 family RNA polymerase sigma factor [Rhodanobacteraceae]SDF44917.1 RNA polymerase sigma-70 factor, ECF subfamily [Dyella sp. 333MFSha]SKB26627.1 RNA polymerase sigma-70 factor, ECF subfamily [Luteibacter sp. 22Crub2.1]
MSHETPSSWARLLVDKGPTLANYFLRRVSHRWDAQDLVQEVYLRLLRNGQGDASDVRNPEAYLFTVAANLVKEHAQMKQRAPISSEGLEDVIERLATPCDAGADVDRALRRERLATLIGRLSPKCRAVLVMHYRDDLSYREIAEQLSISTNMVKKYIVKGLATCRQGMLRYE